MAGFGISWVTGRNSSRMRRIKEIQSSIAYGNFANMDQALVE